MIYEILRANKTGIDDNMPQLLASKRLNTDMNIEVRERTSRLPVIFYSDGTSLLDWRIKGAAGGVGVLGRNYLKQEEKTFPDGSYGIRIYVSSYTSSRTVTFNSGAATGIGLVFKKSDGSNISAADVGTITISASGQSDIVINNTYQGGISTEDVGSSDGRYAVGYGDDGSGRTIIYNNDNTQYIPVRYRTLPVVISENTDYTITRTGGIEDVEFMYTLTKERGDISVYWGSPAVKSIPNNKTPDKDTEQWTRVETDYARITAYGANVQIDSRPATFGNCQYFADLKAGSYKVIAEGLNNTWTSSAIVSDSTPYMALLSESGSTIIQQTALFSDTSLQFHHEEYAFTLSADTKVGLYFKALNQDGYPAYVRFMIVDSDVTAEPFTADITGGGTVSGVTCWEPYHFELPLTIKSGEQSASVIIDVGTAPLGENDTIDLTSTHITIPTYAGKTIIKAGTETQPSEIYIKYKGTGQ